MLTYNLILVNYISQKVYKFKEKSQKIYNVFYIKNIAIYTNF